MDKSEKLSLFRNYSSYSSGLTDRPIEYSIKLSQKLNLNKEIINQLTFDFSQEFINEQGQVAMAPINVTIRVTIPLKTGGSDVYQCSAKGVCPNPPPPQTDLAICPTFSIGYCRTQVVC